MKDSEFLIIRLYGNDLAISSNGVEFLPNPKLRAKYCQKVCIQSPCVASNEVRMRADFCCRRSIVSLDVNVSELKVFSSSIPAGHRRVSRCEVSCWQRESMDWSYLITRVGTLLPWRSDKIGRAHV